MIDEHHWMGRPRACHYYRQVKVLNDTGTRTTWNYVGIVRFDWEEANDSPTPTHDASKRRLGGTILTRRR